MSIEIHNYTCRGQRLVQVETQIHHINGVLDIIQGIRKTSNLDWEDIYSAYYECDEDSTITFYEGESLQAGNPGVWTYVAYDCPEGEEQVIRNPNIEVLVALKTLQQGILLRQASQTNILPYAENAVVDIRKLRDYSLNREHNTGKHKARLFSASLGMTADDAPQLREILLEVVKTHEVQLGRYDEFGQRYTLDFMLEWQGKSALIRSAWIIEDGSTTPKLTTCYPI